MEFTKTKQLPFYMAEIDPSLQSDLEVNFIGLVARPAIEKNFMAFKHQPIPAKFVVNADKRIVSGPAMVADMPLYRNDAQLGEYYVVFDAPAIKTIVEKFSAKGYLKNFNLFHDDNQKVSDVTIFNSFISNKELGVMPLKGFEDTADGSWFISAQVNNEAVWQKVKSGAIKGFSVEGLFTYVPAMKSEEMAKAKIMAITNNVLALPANSDPKIALRAQAEVRKIIDQVCG